MVLEFMNGDGGLLQKVVTDFELLYVKKIFWMERYAKIILIYQLSDAKSNPSTSDVVFLCCTEMFLRGFHYIFKNISLSGNILASESVASTPLGGNQFNELKQWFPAIK